MKSTSERNDTKDECAAIKEHDDDVLNCIMILWSESIETPWASAMTAAMKLQTRAVKILASENYLQYNMRFAFEFAQPGCAQF